MNTHCVRRARSRSLSFSINLSHARGEDIVVTAVVLAAAAAIGLHHLVSSERTRSLSAEVAMQLSRLTGTYMFDPRSDRSRRLAGSCSRLDIMVACASARPDAARNRISTSTLSTPAAPDSATHTSLVRRRRAPSRAIWQYVCNHRATATAGPAERQTISSGQAVDRYLPAVDYLAARPGRQVATDDDRSAPGCAAPRLAAGEAAGSTVSSTQATGQSRPDC